MKLFDTHDEAINYAKQNRGVIITRSSDGKGYIVKESRRASICDILKSKDSYLKSTILTSKKKIFALLKKDKSHNSRSLLIDTKTELNYIFACIMQADVKDANIFIKKAGKLLASKLTGISATGGLLGLVSTLGTSGTGAVIANLSGAAATNATLALVGSVVGGGMVAGTMLTGGLGFLAGFGAYKLLSSKAREYTDLTSYEREIIDKCILLTRHVDELIEKLYFPNEQEMQNLLNESICPLNKLLLENEDKILVNLDAKNRVAFNIHAIPDFEELIKKYKIFINTKKGKLNV